GEPGAERERLALRRPREADVVGHLRAQAAGDVDQHEQRPRAVRAGAAGEVGDLAGAGGGAQGPAGIDLVAAAGGPAAARADLRQVLADRAAQLHQVGVGGIERAVVDQLVDARVLAGALGELDGLDLAGLRGGRRLRLALLLRGDGPRRAA